LWGAIKYSEVDCCDEHPQSFAYGKTSKLSLNTLQ